MSGERLIPFPFQKKQMGNGESLPVVDRVMEESKTLDKWQLVGGGVLAVASLAIPVLAPFAAGTLGSSMVSHELTRDELRVRREKQQQYELKKAA